MSSFPAPPPRKVTLRLSGGDHATGKQATADVDQLFRQAHALGLPLHHDPQVAALLASLRMNEKVPPLLYVAAAAVLAGIYDAKKKA